MASLVNSLGTDIMPSRGSYPAAAIAKGQQLLEQAGVMFGEVVLITDGGSTPQAAKAARELRDAGFTLSVLGVGTLDGAPIPRAGGGFVTNRSGQIVIPRLESDGLAELAAEGGGRYATLSADNRDIELLLSGEVGSGASSDQSLATDQWKEEGPWLLLILVPLASLAFRRGWLLVLLVMVMPLSEPVYAVGWDDIWKTPDQQAQQRLAEGNAAEAADLFEDPQWKAVARYRAGDYPDSAAGFSAGEDADSFYNFGNALARMGEFESAIEAYDRALDIDPDSADATYNRDLVQQLLEEQESQQSDEGDQQQSSEEGGGAQQSESDSESDQSSEEGTDGEPGNESPESEASAREQEMSDEDLQALEEELERAAQEAEQQTEAEQELTQAQAEAQRREQEEQQAMEQWLRRIPDDPGGLLRRKFRYQYQRQGRDQDGNNLWPDDEVQPW